MNKKKTIILLIIGILVVTTLSLGVTYSYMKNKTSGDNETEIGINNCAKITLKDNNSTINLTNMYPMEEEMGLQTEAYEFTVSSTCEEYTGFNLYLLTYEENGIEDNLIRYGITTKNDMVIKTGLIITEEATDLTDDEQKEINQGVNKGYSKIYKILSNNLSLKEEKEYKLHIWIDEKADNSTMNKSIKLGVIIKPYSWDGRLTEYLIQNKDRTLIYHDELPDYEGMVNAELEAGDNSYRFAGASDIVDNYVCFGGECSNDSMNENYSNLYRIIGLFPPDDTHNTYQLKIIKADYATDKELGGSNVGAYYGTYSYGSNYYQGETSYYSKIASYYWNNETNNNDWSKSNLQEKNLNEFYLNYIKAKDDGKWETMIEDHTWKTEGNTWDKIGTQNAKNAYTNEITNPSKGSYEAATTYKAKVGLMYVSDYMYAATKDNWTTLASNYSSAASKNWMYMGLYEWTITRLAHLSYAAFYVYRTGSVDGYSVDNHFFAVRPVLYLKSDVKISTGSGTGDDPYMISM